MSRSIATGGHPGRDRRLAAARRARRPSWSTATTTCSRPIRWRNGRARPSSRTVRDGRLYARGVSDDKGPMLIPIMVAEASCATAGAPAGQRQVRDRRRGGMRQPASRGIRRTPMPSELDGRFRALGRRRHVAAGRALDHGRQPRHRGPGVHGASAPPRICIPAAMAAARPQPAPGALPRLATSLHDAEGASRSTASTTASRPPPEHRPRHDRQPAL